MPNFLFAQIAWDAKANEYIEESVRLEKQGDLQSLKSACDFMTTAYNIATKTGFDDATTRAIDKRKVNICKNYKTKDDLNFAQSMKELQKFAKVMNDTLGPPCEFFLKARNTCATAGSYVKCMEINYGRDLNESEKRCLIK